MQTLVLQPIYRCFNSLNTVFTERYILRACGWEVVSFCNTSCYRTHLNKIILARGSASTMAEDSCCGCCKCLQVLFGIGLVYGLFGFAVWKSTESYYNTPEPLTFKARIICLSTVGAEQNVIARVLLTTRVKGVERLCQVPPGVFQAGEKVRISVRNVLNVLRVWDIFEKIVRFFNYRLVISVIPIIIGKAVF